MENTDIFSLKQNLHSQALSEAIYRSEEEIKKWTNFQKQCEVVMEGLHVLPLELSVNCMIPIGKQALIPGKLKHTNEILVCLGEGYFVKYTAAQAIELTKRRMKRTQDMLTFLKAERNLFETRQNCPISYGAFEDNIKEELIEHWSDQDLDSWRVQHKQREKDYHEQKSKQTIETNKESNENRLTTEEELFRRLDELELEEELEDEYYRLHGEDVDEEEDEEDDDEEEEEEEEEEDEDNEDNDDENVEDSDDEEDGNDEVKDKKEEEKEEKSKSVTSHKLKEVEESLNLKEQSNQINKDENKLLKIKKVSFKSPSNADKDIKEVNAKFNRNDEKSRIGNEAHYNQDSSNTPKINFTHSNVLPQVLDDNNKGINNPSEMYNACFQPKSILKRPRDNSSIKETNFSEISLNEPYYKSETTQPSAFGDVVEQKVQEKKHEFMQTVNVDSVHNKKPISRFKLERVNQNK